MASASASREDRLIFNNYGDTQKRLKFEDTNSCSLMLSKSGASSTAKGQKSKQHGLTGTSRQFSRESSTVPLIMKSFVSTDNLKNGGGGGTTTSAGGAGPIITSSSFTVN